MLSLHSRVRVPHAVLSRRVGDEVVMLHLDREKYFGMNDVGARLMDVVREGAPLAEVVRVLHEEFDADTGTLERDVLRVAGELLAAGLLEESPAP